VDDDPAMHEGLRFILEGEYDLTCVTSGEAAVEACTKETYPVVIMDLWMGGMSGLDALRMIGAGSGKPKVVILTGQDTKESAIEAVNLGAFRYLLKPFEKAELLESLDAAILRFESESKSVPGRNSPDIQGLSGRQMEIVRLVVRGETNREIGERLNISPRTVEKHMQQIFSALKVSSRTKLVAMVSRL